MIRRLFLMTYAVGFFWLMTSSPADAFSAPTGPIIIGIPDIAVQNSKPTGDDPILTKRSDFLATNLKELLPEYIRKDLQLGYGRPVIVVPQSNDTEKDKLDGVVALRIENGGAIGIRVSAVLKVRSGPKSDLLPAPPVVLLLSPTIDFGELDNRLQDYGQRIARALISPPNFGSDVSVKPSGIVGLYCISSDSRDEFTQRLAANLTIELPFYLNRASIEVGFDLTFRGIDITETWPTCTSLVPNVRGVLPSRSTGVEQSDIVHRVENFSWVGGLKREQSGFYLTFQVRDNDNGTNFRPLPAVLITNGGSSDLMAIAREVIEKFKNQVSRGTSRIFLHFGGSGLDRTAATLVQRTLADAGFDIVETDDRGNVSDAGGVDFYSDSDCGSAKDLAQMLSLALPARLRPVPVRLRQTQNSPRSLEVWVAPSVGNQTGDSCHQ
jgi:hypothetical protein